MIETFVRTYVKWFRTSGMNQRMALLSFIHYFTVIVVGDIAPLYTDKDDKQAGWL